MRIIRENMQNIQNLVRHLVDKTNITGQNFYNLYC